MNTSLHHILPINYLQLISNYKLVFFQMILISFMQLNLIRVTCPAIGPTQNELIGNFENHCLNAFSGAYFTCAYVHLFIFPQSFFMYILWFWFCVSNDIPCMCKCVCHCVYMSFIWAMCEVFYLFIFFCLFIFMTYFGIFGFLNQLHSSWTYV